MGPQYIWLSGKESYQDLVWKVSFCIILDSNECLISVEQTLLQVNHTTISEIDNYMYFSFPVYLENLLFVITCVCCFPGYSSSHWTENQDLTLVLLMVLHWSIWDGQYSHFVPKGWQFCSFLPNILVGGRLNSWSQFSTPYNNIIYSHPCPSPITGTCITPLLDFGLCHGICFGQEKISRNDVSRGLKCAFIDFSCTSVSPSSPCAFMLGLEGSVILVLERDLR